jgi:hypothetical protein
MKDLIPLFGVIMPFLMIISIIVIPAWFKSKERREMQATLRAAIEKGQPVPTEMIDAMTRNVKVAPTALSDIRTGVIWIAVGLGVCLFGFMIGFEDADAFHPMLALGGIPIIIGAAYVVLSFFNPNKAKQP